MSTLHMGHEDFVMICQQSWDLGIATNARSMAREIAKTNRVLYVNMPLDVNTVARSLGQGELKKQLRRLFKRTESLVQAEPNVWVLTPSFVGLSINWLPSRKVFKLLNRWNSERLAGSIRQAVQAIGFDSYHLLQDSIIYQGLNLKRLLAPRSFIYYLRDHMLAVPYFQRHGAWVEAELLKQADAVVANSAYLTDYAQEHNPHSYDIGQGCALGMYQAEVAYTRPPDLAVRAPIIGYTGYLTNTRLDANLLLRIAQQRPEWNLVLVGPEDDVFRQSPLHGLPNVFFLGSKLPHELAAYLQHFDVCINPQRVNNLTVGNYPLKIDEYLAMGKPVVATATRAMEMFAAYVYLAGDAESWLRLLETALADHNRERRRAQIAFAQSHTWTASVQKLYAAVAHARQKALLSA